MPMLWWCAKTGFYCDQQVNQQTVASSCADEDVLDSCYFSRRVSFDSKSAVGIDSNDDGMSSTNDNIIANSFKCTCTFTQAGFEDHM